jgi:hypothetical protein
MSTNNKNPAISVIFVSAAGAAADDPIVRRIRTTVALALGTELRELGINVTSDEDPMLVEVRNETFRELSADKKTASLKTGDTTVAIYSRTGRLLRGMVPEDDAATPSRRRA